MDWQHRKPVASAGTPYSPVSGHSSPRHDIELTRPPQDTLSPTPHKEYLKSPLYSRSQESISYHDNLSQPIFIQQDLDGPCEPTPW